MIEAAIGIVVGLGAIAMARALNWQHWYYTVALLTLPVAYGAFAISAGAEQIALKEMILGTPFLVAATALTITRIRQSATLIAVMWLSHGAYDLFHDFLLFNPGVPSWYPVFC